MASRCITRSLSKEVEALPATSSPEEIKAPSATGSMAAGDRKLSAAQRAKIERNRQKALLLKKARLTRKPYPAEKPGRSFWAGKSADAPKKVVDTGAGFFLEDEEIEEQSQLKVVHQPGAIIEGDQLNCDECNREFIDSFLYKNYEVLVCDRCRDSEGKHKLITKSEAKSTYLLKDVDLDKREPPLKFIVKKNPHNSHWGDMKLYLESEVSKRALEVFGSEEKMQERKEQRAENRDKIKQKRFDKKVKELRKAVRSSLYKKDSSSHEHVYGLETYNEEDDTYSKSCTTCGQTISFEKM